MPSGGSANTQPWHRGGKTEPIWQCQVQHKNPLCWPTWRTLGRSGTTTSGAYRIVVMPGLLVLHGTSPPLGACRCTGAFGIVQRDDRDPHCHLPRGWPYRRHARTGAGKFHGEIYNYPQAFLAANGMVAAWDAGRVRLRKSDGRSGSPDSGAMPNSR
jgi:hypothetical protein